MPALLRIVPVMMQWPADLPAQLEALLSDLDGTDVDAVAARVALTRDLLAVGHAPDELLRAHDQGRLALLPVADALQDGGGDTLAAIAERHGVSADDLARLRRAGGLAVSDEPIYGTSLERYAAQLRAVLDAGLGIEALVDFNYVLGAATASIAAGARDAMRALLAQVDPTGSEHTRAVRAAQLSQALLPTVTEVVVVTMEEHVRQLANRELTAHLVAGAAEPSTEVSVAFADLVGYTALGDNVPTDQLSAVARVLEQVTRDALSGQAQLVKTLGDGVMICARSTADVVDTIVHLASEATRAGLPALRVGGARGPALSRAGDWYGSVVNRASRLTGLAEPHQLLVDEEFHSTAAAVTQAWADRGEVPVRGLADAVHCFALTL